MATASVRHVDLDRVAVDGGRADDLLDLLADVDPFRRDVDRVGVEAREVEELLDERAMRWVCWNSASRTVSRWVSSSRSARWWSVVTKPWIVVIGVRSSCAASAMKFVFTSSARSSARRASCSAWKRRTRSSARPVERAERVEQAELLVAEERRVGRRPHDQAAARHFEIDDLTCACGRKRRAPALEALPGVGRDVPCGDDAALGVPDRERARADDRSGGLEHAGSDLLLRLREAEEAGHCCLQACLLRRTPEETDDLRRREAEEERDDAHGRERTGDEREHGVLVRREDRDEERDRDERRRSREEVHPPARDGRLRRPARQRLEAATIESTVQCTKKTITNA